MVQRLSGSASGRGSTTTAQLKYSPVFSRHELSTVFTQCTTGVRFPLRDAAARRCVDVTPIGRVRCLCRVLVAEVLAGTGIHARAVRQRRRLVLAVLVDPRIRSVRLLHVSIPSPLDPG